METRRVLLIEFLTTDRLYQFRSALFPFVRGFVTGRGGAVRWLAFGHGPGAGAERFVVSLPPDEEEALLAAARALRPTHVLTNQPLAAPLVAALRAEAPALPIDVAESVGNVQLERADDLCRWLGWPPPAPRTAALVDVAEPDYSCELVGELARRVRPLVVVVGGPTCFYRAPLAANPAFAEVDLGRAHRPIGCSFCGEPGVPRYPYRTDAVTLALRQIRGAAATLPADRWSGDFLFNGSAAFLRIRRLCEALLGDARPSPSAERAADGSRRADGAPLPPLSLWFYCRLDELRRRASAIEALLPRLAAAGHSLHLFAMGVENFSPAENERFNKGLATTDIEEALAHLRRFEAEWPQTFHFSAHGGLSFILFTPWTTLADLRANLSAALRFGFEDRPFFFASRLQLFERRAVTLLAERDGLLAPGFEDPAFAAYDSGCITAPGQVELPWRFRDPTVAAVYAVSLRIAPPPALPADDPLRARVAQLLHPLRGEPNARFRLFAALLDAAEEGPAGAPALLERVAAHLGAEGPAPAGRPPAPGPADGLRARVAEVLALLVRERRLLRGFRPAAVRDAGADWGESVSVELVRGAGERLHLYLSPWLPGATPAFRRGERFALNYDPATPLDTDEKRDVAGLVLRALERRVRSGWTPP
jgi:hypothetical protein